MVGGRVFSDASTFSILLPKPNTTIDPLFLSASSSSFLGPRSMVSFADVRGEKRGRWTTSSFGGFDDEDEMGEEEYNIIEQREKKRRLSVEQVEFLEKSFEVENKLEPDRKIQLAKDLGLQPRQVAIWFQNRRARWKTKQLEKDYESLEASYSNLKANYDNLLKEKDKLKAEVANLTEKLQEPQPPPPPPKYILDSESPHYTDGVQSSLLLEHCDSSYAFDPHHSDLSQDEEDDLMGKTLILPSIIFPKLEDIDYSHPPESSCHFGFAEEDDAFWSTWSY